MCAVQGVNIPSKPSKGGSNQSITAEYKGKTYRLPIRGGETLAQTLWLDTALLPPALCSGLGQCGACRVQVIPNQAAPFPLLIEENILGALAIEQGWRLACRHAPCDGMQVFIPSGQSDCKGTDGQSAESLQGQVPQQKHAPSTLSPPYGLAVDVGTTSVHWRCIDANGKSLWQGQCLNPQLGAGSDVMSRLRMAASSEGRSRLARPIQRLVQELCSRSQGQIREVCLAGNTAMTTLFLDKDCQGLLAAPYTVPEAGGRQASLEGLPPLWLPPQPAPFIGGDVAAGMAFLLDEKTPYPFLLADMGTNGEFVLALSEKKSWLASVPMGPALEGIGLTYGGVAGPDSIVGFTLAPYGINAVPWEGKTPLLPRISGTGYLSLISLLLRCGVLLADGSLAKKSPSPLAKRILDQVQYTASGEWRLPLPFNVALLARDVEEIMKVKAAFSLAVEALLHAAGLVDEQGSLEKPLRCILAGALGEHAPVQALEVVGFIPRGFGESLQVSGNTSLQGAVRLLQSLSLRERIIAWSRHCKVLPLTDRADFMEDYVRHMHFGTTRT